MDGDCSIVWMCFTIHLSGLLLKEIYVVSNFFAIIKHYNGGPFIYISLYNAWFYSLGIHFESDYHYQHEYFKVLNEYC